MRATTLDGKYTVVLDNNGKLYALRYGQPWRDCCGDNLVFALAQDLETLSGRLARISEDMTDDEMAGHSSIEDAIQAKRNNEHKLRLLVTVLEAKNAGLESSNKDMLEALNVALLELESNKAAMVGPEWASQRTLTGGAIARVAQAIYRATEATP